MNHKADKFVIRGGNKLSGTVSVSGAKNVALKALVAACLTEEKVTIHNVPLISDFFVMIDIIKHLGGTVELVEHTVTIQIASFKQHTITLDQASHIRTSSMFLAPLLVRNKKAIIPNPGGCRLGARPIDRTIEGLKQMGAKITYQSEDGYFHAQVNQLRGTTYTFDKNTHTGTETMIIASVVADGKTTLHNAAEEPEIDELIELLNAMGAKIKRTKSRVIEITGVKRLHGASCTIKPDRNEIVTFAIAALVTKGNVLIENAKAEDVKEFLEKLQGTGAGVTIEKKGIRFFYNKSLQAVDIETSPYPGFMTDWQAPWAVLMTQSVGESVIHETVFENRFGYVKELRKMGAKISRFNPKISDPISFYNFNQDDDLDEFYHAIRITGPKTLHDAVMTISDLRAGASLVVAALAAKGESIIHGVGFVQRGYENFDERLRNLGAQIHVQTE